MKDLRIVSIGRAVCAKPRSGWDGHPTNHIRSLNPLIVVLEAATTGVETLKCAIPEIQVFSGVYSCAGTSGGIGPKGFKEAKDKGRRGKGITRRRVLVNKCTPASFVRDNHPITGGKKYTSMRESDCRLCDRAHANGG
jgi:hypothetical protein